MKDYIARQVNLPSLALDQEFVAWLNDPETKVWTWHEKGQPVGAYSDVVVWVDSNGEGSEDGSMPDRVWKKVVAAMDGVCGLCWITFLGQRDCDDDIPTPASKSIQSDINGRRPTDAGV